MLCVKLLYLLTTGTLNHLPEQLISSSNTSLYSLIVLEATSEFSFEIGFLCGNG
jgi:hypothetical protein